MPRNSRKSQQKSKDMEWHQKILSKAEYRCEVCRKDFSAEYYFQNGKNQYLCGHHIKTKGAFPGLRHDLENGLCVCHLCHTKIHNGEIT